MPGRDTAKVRNTNRISSLTSRSNKRPNERDAAAGRPPKKKVKRVKRVDYHSSSDEADEDAQEDVDGEAVDTSNKASGPNGAPLGLRGLRTVTFAEPAKDAKPSTKEGDQGAEDDVNEEGEDDDDEIEAEISDEEELPSSEAEGSTDAESDEEDEEEDGTISTQRTKKKRADPTAFATSISKILASGLSTTKRADPVLSRSKDASTAVKEVSEQRLEARARHKLRDEKRQAMDRGRVKDVLGLQDSAVSTQAILEEEKRLRKVAQRGVVKLFNAVRAAQAKAEEATEAQKTGGVVGMQKREEKVNEMSKQGFLDLIAAGGK